ncbi:NADH dehydrogenase 1 alpha subcomplex subunit 4 ndufa4 [Apophysomyces sp. BC1015]|nr:NADH dehydrogenase 1 alpha subcomplex subunit 4 ndufa4 [Apophysomyces sp. BC1015]
MKPEIAPLFVILGGALGWAGFMGYRQLRSPEVTLDHKNNPHPWQEIKEGDQVKLLAVKQKHNQRWDRTTW